MATNDDALIAALKREREQLEGRTDPNGVRRCGEVDAEIERLTGKRETRDEPPKSRGRTPQRTTDAS
jgi:hypothetical protein